MKNIWKLLIFILLLNGCDDGDLEVEEIDLGEATPTKCSENNILYKLNSNEVLILLIPEDQEPYKNIVQTVEYPINSSNQVLFRIYNGQIGTDNICATIQPGTPQITEEWIAGAGTIIITTTPVYSTPDLTTGATEILKYNHNIVFQNIVFQKPDGNQVYEEMIFGDYLTSATTLPFSFVPDDVEICTSKNTIYNVPLSRIESLVIQDIDPNLIKNEVGTVTQVIGNTSNQLVYQLYNSAVQLPVSDYFCATTTPILPSIKEIWSGVIGNLESQTGIIEVVTTEEGTGYSHEIRLKNVTFSNGNTTFYYGNNILYGILKTN